MTTQINLKDVSTQDLMDELTRRNAIRCPCGKWRAYIGSYDEDGHTIRCHGCLRSINRCTC